MLIWSRSVLGCTVIDGFERWLHDFLLGCYMVLVDQSINTNSSIDNNYPHKQDENNAPNEHEIRTNIALPTNNDYIYLTKVKCYNRMYP